MLPHTAPVRCLRTGAFLQGIFFPRRSSLGSVAAPSAIFQMKAHNLPRSGFTLIELLVVIAIVGILAAFSLASLKGMLEDASTAKCTSHMKQIAAAAALFAAENDGKLPRLYVHNADASAIVSPFPLPDSQRITMNRAAYFWQDLLLQYASSPQIFSCPKLTLPATRASGGGFSTKFPLGIGINYYSMGLNQNNADGSPIWMRAFQVPQPSLIVWFADAGLDKNGEPTGPWDQRKDAPGTGNSFFRGTAKEAACAMPRHQGRINVAFADGHVATVTPDQINWGGNSTTAGGTNYIGYTTLP